MSCRNLHLRKSKRNCQNRPVLHLPKSSAQPPWVSSIIAEACKVYPQDRPHLMRNRITGIAIPDQEPRAIIKAIKVLLGILINDHPWINLQIICQCPCTIKDTEECLLLTTILKAPILQACTWILILLQWTDQWLRCTTIECLCKCMTSRWWQASWTNMKSSFITRPWQLWTK